jgi:ABC-type bacteriocin/lantibiotic exporter with double-glycine peptidase domain
MNILSTIIRISFTILLLVLMCLDYKWALYLIVILQTITIELIAIIFKKIR